jgi:hypothetical protein
VWIGLLIGLLAMVVAALLWRQHQAQVRVQREREERRARTDQLLARVLLGEERGERHTVGGPAVPALPESATDARDAGTSGTAGGTPGADAAPVTIGRTVDIDILLGDEPNSIAEQARQRLARPTTMLSGLAGESTVGRAEGGAPASPLSLLDGVLDVSLDALVLVWFAARGYVLSPAPEAANPIRLLLTHRDDVERSYAFFFDRGRLHAQRAAELLDKAQALGMARLLVAAEHGADPAVNSARLRDVLVMDWVTLDREFRKIDFRVAAKLIAIARSRRDLLGIS